MLKKLVFKEERRLRSPLYSGQRNSFPPEMQFQKNLVFAFSGLAHHWEIADLILNIKKQSRIQIPECRDTLLAAWPAQTMASMRVCAASKTAPGYRSEEASTVHAAAIDSGINRFLPRERMARWCF